MLGPAKPRRLDEPIAVSLEDLVPARQLLPPPGGQARPWLCPRLDAQELYADRGRPSIDPVVFFKLQLVMFFEGIRSERKLIETASLNLAHRWYLGYALDEDAARPLQPDPHPAAARHRRLSALLREDRRSLSGGGPRLGPRALLRRDPGPGRCRHRLARAALLRRCQSPRRRHLRRIVTGDRRDEPPVACPDGLLRLPEETEANGQCAAGARACRGGICWRSGGSTPGGRRHRGYRRTSDFWVSTTDPDATPMWTAGKARLGYHDHYVVDGGKRRIILAALVTPADVMENQPMLDLLWRVRFRRKLHPRQATGDTTYGTVENIVALEDAGIRAYVPLARHEPPPAVLWPGRLCVRRGARRVPLPGRSRAGARAGQAHRGRHRLPG